MARPAGNIMLMAESEGELKSLLSRSAHSSEQGPLYNTLSSRHQVQDFPGVPMAKNPPANAEDVGLIPGLGRFHRHSL